MKSGLTVNSFTILLFVALLSGCKFGGGKTVEGPELSFDQRANIFISLMTLEEKVDMLRYDSPGVPRIGIPAHNFWNECLHGVARSGRATVFPQAIGMGAMWDRGQMRKIADAISDEARAKHHEYASRDKRGIYQGLTYWTPNINIFRDPRWGRGMETYGEDPYLTAETAIPFIKGLQGEDDKYFKLIATAKHFAVHSGPESTRHSFDVNPSDYDLAETYLPHFKRAVKEAGVYSVMCAYQSLRGLPCCGSEFLSSMLREQWGFKGYIVSDCWAIVDFYNEKAHHVASSPEEAAAMAIRAGTDLNCGSTYPYLVQAVQQGILKEEELDVPVKRILIAMMRLGLIDPNGTAPYSDIPYSVVESEEHIKVALEAARKSMVLLKNEKNTLPFSKDVRKVAVIGPNADELEVLLGNYNGYPTNPKTPLTGIREKLPNAEVVFAQGCELAAGLPYFEAVPSSVLFSDTSRATSGLKAEYFANPRFEGSPAHERIDPNVDFVWWDKSPFADMKADSFSVRWTGVFVPPVSGEYALGGEGFSGFNLYLDGTLVTKWMDVHHPRKVYEKIKLEAGRSYDIRLEYMQRDATHSIMRLLWDRPGKKLKEEAIELAKASDIVVLCMGLSPLLEGEEMPVKVEGFEGGDRVDIKLPATQTALMKEIHRLGKPTVLVLLNGSAIAFNWEAENIPAIIEAWYPGQQGGAALADILFGDYNPAGRLPVTFYKNIKDIPAFDNYDMAGKTYRYFKGTPLYKFGHGLSYTTFEYELSVGSSMIAGKTISISVLVKNTGSRDGDEVVQMYVSLPDSKLRTPVRSLQGFERVHLKAGESKLVRFILKPSQMAGRDENNIAIVEPGRMIVSIGGKQPDARSIAARRVAQMEMTITPPASTVPENEEDDYNPINHELLLR